MSQTFYWSSRGTLHIQSHYGCAKNKIKKNMCKGTEREFFRHSWSERKSQKINFKSCCISWAIQSLVCRTFSIHNLCIIFKFVPERKEKFVHNFLSAHFASQKKKRPSCLKEHKYLSVLCVCVVCCIVPCSCFFSHNTCNRNWFIASFEFLWRIRRRGELSHVGIFFFFLSTFYQSGRPSVVVGWKKLWRTIFRRHVIIILYFSVKQHFIDDMLL